MYKKVYYKKIEYILKIVILLLTIFIPKISFSTPLFIPGQTLNPGCLPSNADCAVNIAQWMTNGTSTYYGIGNVGVGTSTPNGSFTIVSATSSPFSLAVYGGDIGSTTGSAISLNTSVGGVVGYNGYDGGNFLLTTGDGGADNSFDSSGHGGAGGSMNILIGNGGIGYGGGSGGSFSLTSGNGYSGFGPGQAGAINFTSGNGANGAFSATHGGDITFTTGIGAIPSLGSASRGGNILFMLGAGGSGGANGKIGIGTSTPSATLTIQGTPTTTLVRLVDFGAGSLSTDADGNLMNTSDERLKDIQGDYVKGLSEIEQLTPINYKWKTSTGLDASTTYSGFSAQNVQAAIPEAIGKNGAGFLTLNDRPIIAALVNAVKSIGSFITKIEGGIAYLKNIVAETLAIGSKEKPAGITMYSKNGNVFCVTVSDSGSFESTAGECQQATINLPVTNTASVFVPTESSTTTNIVDILIASSTVTTSDMIIDNATTTEIILDPATTSPIEIFLAPEATTTP